MSVDLTSGKAVAGLGFAVTGYFSAEFYQQLLDEVHRGTWVSPLSAVLGFIVGWRVMGDMLGCDFRTAARRGIFTVSWFFIWAVVLFATADMIQRSMEKRYPNTGEAIGVVFEIMWQFTLRAADLKVVSTLVLGAMASGILAEMANRRWR